MMVPAEHLGQARMFRQSVVVADHRVNVGLSTIAEPLRRRLARKPTLRSDQVIDTSRAWAELVSDAFTLGLRINPRKGSLSIIETRVCGGKWRSDGWDEPDWQSGISVIRITLMAEDGCLKTTVQPLANLLLHALARRFERGDGRTTGTVVRDLKALASGASGCAIAIPVPSGGRWIGERKAVRDEGQQQDVTVFDCKTYLH